jgi:hypothetical protein
MTATILPWAGIRHRSNSSLNIQRVGTELNDPSIGESPEPGSQRGGDPLKVKRRSGEDRRFGGGCDAETSQTLAEDYRDPDRQGQDRPLISEDGQSAHMRVGLPRSRRP